VSQTAASSQLGQEAPDALLAYRRLTTQGEASAGFDALFQSLCAPAPVEVAAHAAIRNMLESRTTGGTRHAS